jgi:antibiotic biosynthesis monooxygenase (ABM) superfamily enzyme
MVITLSIMARHLRAFEKWLGGVGAEILTFEGFISRDVILPEEFQLHTDVESGDVRPSSRFLHKKKTHKSEEETVIEVLVIVSFNSAVNLEAWQRSPQRKTWLDVARNAGFLKAVQDQVQGSVVVKRKKREIAQTAAATSARPPPKYRLYATTWLAVFLVILLDIPADLMGCLMKGGWLAYPLALLVDRCVVCSCVRVFACVCIYVFVYFCVTDYSSVQQRTSRTALVFFSCTSWCLLGFP